MAINKNIIEKISPASLKIESQDLQIGNKFCRTLFVLNYPRFLQSGWFTPIINLAQEMDIAMVIYPAATDVVLKSLQKSTTRVQSQINIEAEKGKIRNPMLEAAHRNMEELRDKLQTGQEKMFKFGLYITVYADSKKKLDENSDLIIKVLESRLVNAKPANFQMMEGFQTTLPLLSDKLLVHNSLNTEPLSSTFPFVSLDLTSNQGILYGINQHNNSLILFDRFSLENANFTIFASSGAGKSYLTKLEVIRSMMTGNDIIIIDPENEYQYLAETLNGSFAKIALDSPHNINPLDLPALSKDDDPGNAFMSNLANVSGLLKIMLGEQTDSGSQLNASQEALIDKALRETYALKDIDENISREKFSTKQAPLLGDLQDILDSTKGAEELALRLEKYTKGSFSGFLNKTTNIGLNNQLVVFNIRDMEDELRPIAMYLVLNHIWKQIRTNLKKRLLVVDEAWWMMRHKQGAQFLLSMVKRARKYYLGVTTITQDIDDFLKSPYGKPIITNSAMRLLMKQSPAAIEQIVKTFNLTDQEKYLLMEAGVGEGILFAGQKHAAIRVVASYSEDQIITSDPQQLLEIEKQKHNT